MPEIQLDPCPFCGGDATINVYFDRSENSDEAIFIAECNNCNMKGPEYRTNLHVPSNLNDIAQNVAKIWNSRICTREKLTTRWVLDGDGIRCEACNCKIPHGVASQIDFNCCPHCGLPVGKMNV